MEQRCKALGNMDLSGVDGNSVGPEASKPARRRKKTRWMSPKGREETEGSQEGISNWHGKYSQLRIKGVHWFGNMEASGDQGKSQFGGVWGLVQMAGGCQVEKTRQGSSFQKVGWERRKSFKRGVFWLFVRCISIKLGGGEQKDLLFRMVLPCCIWRGENLWGKQNNGQTGPRRSSWNLWIGHLPCQKGLCRYGYIKNSEMRRRVWIIQVSNLITKVHASERGRQECQNQRRWDDMIKAEVTWCGDPACHCGSEGRRGLQGKGCG